LVVSGVEGTAGARVGSPSPAEVAIVAFTFAAAAASSVSHEHAEILPRFVQPIENITAVQGRDVSFTCIVDHIGPYRVNN